MRGRRDADMSTYQVTQHLRALAEDRSLDIGTARNALDRAVERLDKLEPVLKRILARIPRRYPAPATFTVRISSHEVEALREELEKSE
ncbi:MAG TPA: hypothetical protein PLF13_14510 [candidate division Zixibacteria bacterium]|nr:hypothetical protein [candidate division Zixibacteria bacterium]